VRAAVTADLGAGGAIYVGKTAAGTSFDSREQHF
jgi:hypothetical protein